MNQRKNREFTFKHILLLYLLSFVIHTILNILVNEGPTVIIDEGLYTNIARSLAWEGTIAYRSQPVDYPYIFYPLLLVPVYRLNELLGGDIYRWVQVFNTLLITSSVIPAWFFALDHTKNSRKAFAAALLTAIMPDMIMGGYLMTESILWPMALWLLFFSYRWFIKGNLSYGLMTALVTALMFFTKPGAVAFGAVLIAVNLVYTAVKNRQKLFAALLPVLLLLILIAGVYVLYVFGFNQQRTILGLYDKQTSEWRPKDILVALEASFLLTFLFIFACGGVFAVLPLVYYREYDLRDRLYIAASYLGILAVILGTAVFVVPYKWDSSLGKLPLHLRYCSMFIPAFFVLSLGIDLKAKQVQGREKIFRIAMIAFGILSLFPGARSGFVPGKTGTIDSVVLSSFHTSNRLNGTAAGWLVTIAMLGFCAYLTVGFSKGWEKDLQKKAVTFFMGFMLVNALCAHINAAVPIDRTIGKDANEVRALVRDQSTLGITQRFYDDIYSYWLESRLNRPMQQVTIEQLFVEALESGGVYEPFIPVEQAPNINNYLTPDTDTFVLGMTVAENMELADGVKATASSNGHFTVVQITPGERWVDSMIYGLDDYKVSADHPCNLHIFDESLNSGGSIHLSLTAAGNADLIIADRTLHLDPEKTGYDLELPFSASIPIRIENGNAEIYSYTIESTIER